ncbi:MAG: hypothetical protein QNL33_02415 [Akkermansiaceae bacterium]
MTISLTDEQGETQTKSVRLDSLTIETTIPELRSLAVFFTECTRDVGIEMATAPVLLKGYLPDYGMTVPEIIIES